MKHSEQGQVHAVGLGRNTIRQGRQVQPAAPASQEHHSLGQSLIPRRNPVANLVPPGPSGIAPPIVSLSNYEQLQKIFEEMKHQNNKLKMNNEESMRRLQGITTLLHELMTNIHIPHMGQTSTGREHWRSQSNSQRTIQQGIRIRTPRLNNHVSEMANPRREYDQQARKAPMYEEIVENTPLRALYVSPPFRNKAEQETLKTFDIKRLIEQVLEQKQVMMVPKEIPTKEFPPFEECQRQPVQPVFKFPQLSIYFGKEDPEKYLQQLVTMAVLHGWNQVTKCRAFPLFLARQAQ